MQGIELRIKGKVQGVGFRPFVWLLANQYGLNGDVNNDGQGVLIRFVSPPANALEQFLSDLQNKLPPLAQITDITQRTIDWPEAATVTSFTIRESENNQMDTQIIPDAATCPHCLADLFDPNNRRYHYPFTNCTHCGPRFTIIKAFLTTEKTRRCLFFRFAHNVKKNTKIPLIVVFMLNPMLVRSAALISGYKIANKRLLLMKQH